HLERALDRNARREERRIALWMRQHRTHAAHLHAKHSLIEAKRYLLLRQLDQRRLATRVWQGLVALAQSPENIVAEVLGAEQQLGHVGRALTLLGKALEALHQVGLLVLEHGGAD